MFRAAASAGKRELVVRRDTMTDEEAVALESGSDSSLFAVTSLNHLQISGFASLPLPPALGRLEGLLQLSLTRNHLRCLPQELGQLSRLKLLDVSHNDLAILPSSLYRLPALQSLLMAHNALTDESFQPVEEGAGPVLPCLHHLDVAHNRLSLLPSFLTHTLQLAELKASHNSLSCLDAVVGSMAGLRLLELQNNQLSSVPPQLAACSKLRSLMLDGNPLQDRRLLKLVGQHGATKPRAVLDYVASKGPQPVQAAGKKGKKKGKGRGREEPMLAAMSDSEGEIEFREQLPVVRVIRPAPSQAVEVLVRGEARKVRPYLVCAVVRAVDLSQPETLREFISLQTKLHDGLCKRRRAATIATHDLNKITTPINFECAAAPDITIQPLGWKEEATVQAFLDHVQANKPDRSAGKKAKNVDTAAAVLNKYLSYVDPVQLVYLRDSAGKVISLPPLTNCEGSKVEALTTDLLLEVTSSQSLATVKAVMDALVEGIVRCVSGESGMGEDGVCVEQVRVEEEGGKLLVLYPSRTDLTAGTLDVRRPA